MDYDQSYLDWLLEKVPFPLSSLTLRVLRTSYSKDQATLDEVVQSTLQCAALPNSTLSPEGPGVNDTESEMMEVGQRQNHLARIRQWLRNIVNDMKSKEQGTGAVSVMEAAVETYVNGELERKTSAALLDMPTIKREFLEVVSRQQQQQQQLKQQQAQK